MLNMIHEIFTILFTDARGIEVQVLKTFHGASLFHLGDIQVPRDKIEFHVYKEFVSTFRGGALGLVSFERELLGASDKRKIFRILIFSLSWDLQNLEVSKTLSRIFHKILDYS